MQLPEHFETSRLRLRKLRLSDAQAMFEEYASDPRVTRFLIEPTHASVDATERFVAARLSDWEEGRRWTFAIVLKDEADRAIGRIGLKTNPEGVSIGYALAYRLFGRGLAAEAVTALCPVAQAMTNYLFARADAENAASIRVLEKTGFRFVERQNRALVMPNIGPEPRDCVIYAKKDRAA